MMNEYAVSIAAMSSCLFLATTLSHNVGLPSPVYDEPYYFPYHYSAPASVAINAEPQITGDVVVDYYQPRTDLGKKLLSLRREYVLNGGRLLTETELLDEIHLRRGGILNA
ncbi:MAG: hypothetical protein ACYCSS_14985 [Sulfuriferula sp.]